MNTAIHRLHSLVLSLVVLPLIASAQVGIEPRTPERQPNIVHIMIDDLGWQDVRCYYRDVHGEEAFYETPHNSCKVFPA